jgi:hypothetical protein
MKHLLRAFAYSAVIAIITLSAVAFGWKNPLILTVCLIFLSALMLILYNNKEDFYLYIISGMAGAIVEAIAIAFGAWQYAFPQFIGIPYWLPFLWGIAALFIKRVINAIHQHLLF